MLPSVKNASGTETKVLSKREEKKRINIRSNSVLFFQLGLVFSLLLFLFIMESNWKLSSTEGFSPPNDFGLVEPALMAYRVEEPNIDVKPQKKLHKRVIQKPLANTFTTIPNNSPTLETDTSPSELTLEVPSKGKVKEPTKKLGPSNINTVQFVPVFPGCESLSNNAERRACMSSKINAFINKKFNTDKFSDLESDKVHTINVLFTIGKDGKVKDIRARAKLPELEKEAQRVIAKMPLMQAGKQGNTKVEVLFMVPIKFQIQ